MELKTLWNPRKTNAWGFAIVFRNNVWWPLEY